MKRARGVAPAMRHDRCGARVVGAGTRRGPRAACIGAAAGVVAMAFAGAATAQVSTTGTIFVIVEDEGGGRVPGAAVTADATDSVTRRTAVSDARGEAALRQLDPSAGYVVTVALQGFRAAERPDVLVRAGHTTTLRVGLVVGSVSEELTVTAETPLVDTSNASTGQDLTLELVEALPTGRSFESYLQLVPGVLPSSGGFLRQAPAARSGTNYSAGQMGWSRDNFYYVDGINVTDGIDGVTYAALNPEVIQEQQVLTGGLPAEFVGAPGLISNVITKSGSDELHGSVNYFFQSSSLVAENENAPEQRFSTFDAAATLGGPVVKSKLWFFASYRRRERDEDVTALDTQELLRTVEIDEDHLFGRLSWAPTMSDTLSFTFFADPSFRTGSVNRGTPNSRDSSAEFGGSKYGARYTKLLGPVVVELSYGQHNFQLDRVAALREPSNTVIYHETDARTLADENLGGAYQDVLQHRRTGLYKAAFQWALGSHHVKGGVELLRNEPTFERRIVGGASFVSLAPHLAGTSARELSEGSFSAQGFDPFAASDYNGFIATVNASPRRASFYAAFDANGDGVIDPDELADGLRFSSSLDNPHGAVNHYREIQAGEGSRSYESRGLSFYLQDTVRLGPVTLNAGVRTERFKHFATTGENLFTFAWTWAPRVSAVWDLAGDGRQKLSAHYGRYFDPVRTNMTNFTGTLTGPVYEEQVFANGEWVTFLTRGGSQQPDAVFAPTTRTPWTEDIQLGYAIDLGSAMSLEAIITNRRTRDILEDYALSLYAFRDDGSTSYPGPVDHPDSLFLGLDYFGFTSFPESNFVVATLAGAERDYRGAELVFRKRRSDRWQALASYTFGAADGNAESDSQTFLQGDLLFLDPRAPGRHGDMPGSIHHLFKLAASYSWDFGLELGGTYRWNSGTLATRRIAADIPARVPASEAFEFAGITTRWVAPDAVGSLRNPAGGQLDLRVRYARRLGKAGLEAFLDAFNVFDDQGATRNEDRVAGSGSIAFGEAMEFRAPRRFYLGARVSF